MQEFLKSCARYVEVHMTNRIIMFQVNCATAIQCKHVLYVDQAPVDGNVLMNALNKKSQKKKELNNVDDQTIEKVVNHEIDRIQQCAQDMEKDTREMVNDPDYHMIRFAKGMIKPIIKMCALSPTIDISMPTNINANNRQKEEFIAFRVFLNTKNYTLERQPVSDNEQVNQPMFQIMCAHHYSDEELDRADAPGNKGSFSHITMDDIENMNFDLDEHMME